MRNGILICQVILIYLLSLSEASAQEHYSGYGEICYPCHDILLTYDEKISKLSRCSCHSAKVVNWKEDRAEKSRLRKIHGSSPCVKCHGGVGLDVEDMQVIHKPHESIGCTLCHGEGKVVKPVVKDCFDCHQREVHKIHNEFLLEICTSCHGKVIQKFPELQEEVGIVIEIPQVEEKRVFSLYDLIKSIFLLSFVGV
jgi:hypothetical protein